MDTPCIIWNGRINADGYGTHSKDLAHREAWESKNGPVPGGLELDHLCRVRACVNPDHLEPVTHAENVRRAQAFRVLKVECRHGHVGEYRTGSNGKRYCAGCKRDRGAREYVPSALGQPCPRGHVYDRETGKGVRCSVCMSDSGRTGMAIRWGTRR